MANLSDERTWTSAIVRVIVYAVIALAVAYAVVHFEAHHYLLGRDG
jgi:hypothetical protein